MPKNQTVTLVHPDGKRTYETADPAEQTRLKAQGYTVQQPAKAKTSPSSSSQS